MALDLWQDEINFLDEHSLSEDDVFDWRGLNSNDRKVAIKQSGKSIALGTMCRKSGHRLKSRAGHCVQCDSSKLSFQSRKYIQSIIYAAYSKSRKYFKVGISRDLDARLRNLNSEHYGSASDWTLFMAVEVINAGDAETKIHRLLRPKSVSEEYKKNGKAQISKEIFYCSIGDIKQAFLDAIDMNNVVEGGYKKPPPKTDK